MLTKLEECLQHNTLFSIVLFFSGYCYRTVHVFRKAYQEVMKELDEQLVMNNYYTLIDMFMW